MEPSWSDLRYCPGIFVKMLKDLREILGEEIWCPGREWKEIPFKLKSHALLIVPRCPMLYSITEKQVPRCKLTIPCNMRDT
jgi:hypothetical protein